MPGRSESALSRHDARKSSIDGRAPSRGRPADARSAAQQEDRLHAQLALDLTHDRQRCDRLRRILHGTRVRLDRARKELSVARRSAELDHLTGLPNRRAFDNMGQELLRGGPLSPGLTAILFVDLDGFKPVNDQFGHVVGDSVLCLMADRRRRAIRSCDHVYRVAGDEFVCVLLNLPHAQQALKIAQQIVQVIAVPCDAVVPQLGLRASVGVALHSRGDVNVVQLCRRADQAMYIAKGMGGGMVAGDLVG